MLNIAINTLCEFIDAIRSIKPFRVAGHSHEKTARGFADDLIGVLSETPRILSAADEEEVTALQLEVTSLLKALITETDDVRDAQLFCDIAHEFSVQWPPKKDTDFSGLLEDEREWTVPMVQTVDPEHLNGVIDPSSLPRWS